MLNPPLACIVGGGSPETTSQLNFEESVTWAGLGAEIPEMMVVWGITSKICSIFMRIICLWQMPEVTRSNHTEKVVPL